MASVKEEREQLEERKERIREKDEEKEENEEKQVPLMALNHVSRLCKSVKKSIKFYEKILGFVLIDRPKTFDFNGAWLFNYGVGIHLVQSENARETPETDGLDPMDNHISFQCEDMDAMERKLKEMNTEYIKRSVEDENGSKIDQLFFKDPDGFMIEICNCENMKLHPAGSLGRIKLSFDRHNPPLDLNRT